MVQVRVFVNNISAERFWDIEKPIPPVQVATNLNVVGINEKREDMLEVPFVFTINYTPAVAQISLKGKSHVTGSKDELKQIRSAYEEKNPPPPIIVQSISNVVFLESVIVCRTLNIPPPIPLPKIPSVKKKKPSEPTYRA
ncbi:MAG: hypothetical protein OEX10_00320 [Candidatus Bathyarchaeota archaeon]|nr:hypothetical protein [Candidatus Bathyarchaeota archaeon]MDH5663164.1 hypothetical protein [Candidatus Bathyarchaeota archaeon]